LNKQDWSNLTPLFKKIGSSWLTAFSLVTVFVAGMVLAWSHLDRAADSQATCLVNTVQKLSAVSDLADLQTQLQAISQQPQIAEIVFVDCTDNRVLAASNVDLVGTRWQESALASRQPAANMQGVAIPGSKSTNNHAGYIGVWLDESTASLFQRSQSARLWFFVLLPTCAIAGWVLLYFNSRSENQITSSNRNQTISDSERESLGQDKLTELLSREQIQSRIQLAANSNQDDYAILFLDLRRFKFVNDSLGHELGDVLLQSVALRLQQFFSSNTQLVTELRQTHVARLGGDKFVALLEGTSSNESVLILAEQLFELLYPPYGVHRHTLHTPACMSVVYGGPRYRSYVELLRDAETALFEAKRLEKSCIVFDDSMREKLKRRQMLESELFQAVERDEIQVHFQPIVDLTTGKIHSFEALCRWQHPQLGMVSPVEFIPIAEENGEIVEIGNRVLELACKYFAERLRSDEKLQKELININISRRQLIDPKMVETVRATIERYGLEPGQIELEITENAIAEDLDRAAERLAELKEVGVRLALDDFGVGISSFASLHRFPVDTLKIDRSLTKDLLDSPEAVALIQGLVVISHSLQIDLVVEGIENLAQLELLQNLGCHQGQGYLFSPPVSSSKLLSIVDSNYADLVGV
jgi:diguanylate cyclase (GGDEF)-like protein